MIGGPVGRIFISCCRPGNKAITLEKHCGKCSHDELRHSVVCDGLHLLASCADGE
jgi:nicotinamide mononucleotide (NMN) deamidase PncC